MLQLVAGMTGLEPAASGVTGRRSNQTELHPLYINCIYIHSNIYNLNNKKIMVGDDGIEPPTYSV